MDLARERDTTARTPRWPIVTFDRASCLQRVAPMRTTLKTLLAFAVLALAACNDDDPASLRIVHASPGAPAVDVFADNVLLVSDLAYGQVSPYVDVNPGTYNIVVRVAGTDTVVYESDPLAFLTDARITAVAAGTVGSTDPADAFRVLPLFEAFTDYGAPASVRVVHASPDAPTIDVDVGDDGTVEIATLTRFEATPPEGIALPATSLQLGIVANGARLTAFTTPTLPDSDLFVIAIGLLSDLPRESTGFDLLVVGPGGVIALVRQNPTVYALHASPDAPAVDIRLGNDTLFPDVAFGQLSQAQLIPGDYALSIFPAGGTTQVATGDLPALLAGERYLTVALGMLTPVADEPALQLATYIDEFVVDGNPRLRAINVSPDAPLIDISTVTGNVLSTPTLVRNLAFSEATAAEGVAVPASSSVNIGVAAASTTTPVAVFTLDTTGIPRAFTLTAGALTPAPGEQGFQLLVVNTAASPWSVASVSPN